jgi:hypothetical protein
MSRIFRLGIALIVIALIAGGVYFAYQNKGDTLASWTTNTADEPVCEESGAVLDRSSLPPITLPPRTPPEGYSLYRNEEYRFSVFHKTQRIATEYREANGGFTVVFQNPETGRGFQVFIVPYTKDHITESRFKADIRTGVIEASSTIPLDGICATTFLSKSIAIGETREVWAIHNGYLYEITTFRELDEVMQQVVDSWRFL